MNADLGDRRGMAGCSRMELWIGGFYSGWLMHSGNYHYKGYLAI